VARLRYQVTLSYVGNFIATMKEFPPRQKAASFNLDEVMQEMTQSGAK
jgi:hypothetical protein